MTDWNRIKGQLQQATVQPGNLQRQYPLPEWALFLVWAGYWLATHKYHDRRILMTILLPTRVCGPIFCALGGLLGSASSPTQSDLSFDEFSRLPTGAVVYLKQNGTPLTATVGDEDRSYGDTFRRVSIASGGKDMKGSTFFLKKSNFSSYEISLVPHATGHSEVALRHAGKFYSELTGNEPKTWLRKKVPEVALWSNKAGWQRDVAGLRISARQQRPVPIEDILLLRNGRVLLKSSRSKVSRYHDCPLVILDGPESFSRIPKVRAKNILMLVERSEYSSSGAEAVVAEIAGYDRALLNVKELGSVPDLPPGAEMMVASFDDGGQA